MQISLERRAHSAAGERCDSDQLKKSCSGTAKHVTCNKRMRCSMDASPQTLMTNVIFVKGGGDGQPRAPLAVRAPLPAVGDAPAAS